MPTKLPFPTMSSTFSSNVSEVFQLCLRSPASSRPTCSSSSSSSSSSLPPAFCLSLNNDSVTNTIRSTNSSFLSQILTAALHLSRQKKNSLKGIIRCFEIRVLKRKCGSRGDMTCQSCTSIIAHTSSSSSWWCHAMCVVHMLLMFGRAGSKKGGCCDVTPWCHVWPHVIEGFLVDQRLKKLMRDICCNRPSLHVISPVSRHLLVSNVVEH